MHSDALLIPYMEAEARYWALTGLFVVCVCVCITDTQILASGSMQIPRFTLLESGGLQVQPVVMQDTGMYTCYAANSEGAINASASLTVWSKRNT